MEQALPVENVPFDETVELTGDVSDMSVEQYLSWVRTQSNRLPTVFRADNIESNTAPTISQTKYMPEVEAIPTCPTEYLPSEDWERSTLFTFSELRLSLAAKSESTVQSRLVSVPAMKDRVGWLSFCLNVDTNQPDCTTIVDQTIMTEDEPDSDISVKKRKRALAESLGIAMDIEDITGGTCNNDDENNDQNNNDEEEEEEEDVEASATSPLPQGWQGERGVKPTLPLLLQLDQVLTQRLLLYLIDYVDQFTLTSSACEWIYALLSRVEKPLHRDVVAALRQLFRRCCKLRSELSSNDTSFDENLAALNLLIAITGNYFGQDETLQSYFSEKSQAMTEDEEDVECSDEDENAMDETDGYDGGSFDRPNKFSRLG